MNKKGFTLTELIAVVAIIGIIMLITIPVINNMIENNEKEKYMKYVAMVEKALYTYADMEMYTPEGTNVAQTIFLSDLTDGGYIKQFDEPGITAEFKGNYIIMNYKDGKVSFSEVEIKFSHNGTSVASCKKNSCQYYN